MSFAVDCFDFFAFVCCPDDDSFFCEVAIECVEWLAEFGRDVVRDINDIVVCLVSNCFESFSHPIW